MRIGLNQASNKCLVTRHAIGLRRSSEDLLYLKVVLCENWLFVRKPFYLQMKYTIIILLLNLYHTFRTITHFNCDTWQLSTNLFQFCNLKFRKVIKCTSRISFKHKKEFKLTAHRAQK